MESTPKSALFECLQPMSVSKKRDESLRVRVQEDGGDFHTHVSMVYPKGKFQMNVHEIENFWKLYCETVASLRFGNTEIQSGLGLAEKPTQYVPVMADFDIKLEDTFSSFPVYTKAQITQVVSVYVDVLRTILDVDPAQLVCCVLEKPHYVTTVNGVQYVKNGFHLHFPYIFLDKKDHHVFLVPHILPRIKDIFANLVEDSTTLFDKQYFNVPWLMYGSHKQDNVPYLLSYILDAHCSEISIQDAFSQYRLYNADEKLIDISNKEQYYLPRILSTIPFHRKVCAVKTSVQSPIRLQLKPVRREMPSVSDTEVAENIAKAQKILPLLADWRAAARSDWIMVGWVLYNVGRGTRDAFDLWIDFSQRCPSKFSEAVCIYEWENMEVRDITLGTLMYFAKNDNPKLYAEFISSLRTVMEVKDTHADIARRMYELYGNEYVCVSPKNSLWYKFENHHWRQIDGVVLHSKIDDIISEYEEERRKFLDLLKEATDRYKKMYEAGIKALDKVIKDLKSHPFKCNVLKECAVLFYNERFLEKLDANRYLFGFQNGVYDLKTNKLRDGIPEDYISTQSPLNYTEFTRTDPKVVQVYECLRKTFPDNEVYDFFMDTTSEVFVGGNDRKLVLFWSGRGNNGKSVIQSFIEKILGPYSIKFPTALITGKRAQSSSCTPELVRAGNGVRWAVVQEPDETEYINIGVLKELSGNDTFYARGLYTAGREINPMFKLLVVCNKQPKLPHIDQATINRLCVIPYESTFSDNAPETYEEQLRQKVFPKMGNYIRDKVPELAEAFLWVLMEHRKGNTDGPVPTKVRCATEKYIQRNDYYRQFVEENLTTDPGAKISTSELYMLFKDWYRSSIPNSQLPCKTDVVDYFEIVWGSPKAGAWRGYRVKTCESVSDEECVTTDARPPL